MSSEAVFIAIWERLKGVMITHPQALDLSSVVLFYRLTLACRPLLGYLAPSTTLLD